MHRGIPSGLAAGALGTVALNVVTYLDMAARGRPSSEVPAQVAETLAGKAGVEIGDEETARNRSSGVGALLGYVTGLGIGAAYGLVRPHIRGLPLPLAAVGIGAAAMAGSDVPATALGLTDPSEWPASSWASDIVPHLIYGLVTALAYDALAD